MQLEVFINNSSTPLYVTVSLSVVEDKKEYSK